MDSRIKDMCNFAAGWQDMDSAPKKHRHSLLCICQVDGGVYYEILFWFSNRKEWKDGLNETHYPIAWQPLPVYFI